MLASAAPKPKHRPSSPGKVVGRCRFAVAGPCLPRNLPPSLAPLRLAGLSQVASRRATRGHQQRTEWRSCSTSLFATPAALGTPGGQSWSTSALLADGSPPSSLSSPPLPPPGTQRVVLSAPG